MVTFSLIIDASIVPFMYKMVMLIDARIAQFHINALSSRACVQCIDQALVAAVKVISFLGQVGHWAWSK